MRKNAYFEHKPSTVGDGVCTFIFTVVLLIVLIFLYALSENEFLTVAVFILAVVIYFVIMASVEITYKDGIYIKNDEIYEAGLDEKINPQNIRAIKILKHRAGGFATGNMLIRYYPKNKDGSYMYSMLLLNEIKEGMKEYKGSDSGFEFRYVNSVMARALYDDEFIHYIRRKNTNIIIMPDTEE